MKIVGQKLELQSGTDTKKSIFLTFLTTFGLKNNKNYGIATNELTLDYLFKK